MSGLEEHCHQIIYVIPLRMANQAGQRAPFAAGQWATKRWRGDGQRVAHRDAKLRLPMSRIASLTHRPREHFLPWSTAGAVHKGSRPASSLRRAEKKRRQKPQFLKINQALAGRFG